MRGLVSAFSLALCLSPAFAQDAKTEDQKPKQQSKKPAAKKPVFRADQVSNLPWRNIGPANMAGRITDIDVHPKHLSTWYVASAGGGLWKTRNAGTTWEALFQHQTTVSIGDVAIAPANPDIVWVGSGEENGRNSVSFGDGVYKSVDGGKTFTNMGLKETFQIGHIAIHPINSDIVYVAALGRLWGHNPDRGVFRTKDGGETWQKILYFDEKTGCIDIRIDPNNNDILYACMYERMRDQFDSNDPIVRIGEKSGIYRSENGGDTWDQVTDGLPSCNWGRSGLALSGTTPGKLFATIETEKTGWANAKDKFKKAKKSKRGNAFMGINGRSGVDDEGAVLTNVTAKGPSAKAGLKAGDRIVKIGDTEVESYRDLTKAIRTSKGGDKVKVSFVRKGETKSVELTYGKRPTSGRGGSASYGQYAGRLRGQNANVQKNQGEAGFETGGYFVSEDYGKSWKRVNSLTERPFYYSVIAADPQSDDNLYACGTNFWGSSDGGKKFSSMNRGIHVDFHAIWVDPSNSDHLVLGCDGGLHVTFDRCKTWQQINNFVIGQFYHANADNSVPYRVYGGLQDNGTWAGPSRTRFREGATQADWVTIMGGDGFRARIDPEDPNIVFATSQNGNLGRIGMDGTGGGRVQKPRGLTKSSWDSPFFLSPHNNKILYFAGSHAVRSLDRGRNSELISPYLPLTERGAATAFDESPVKAGILYVGTDDGALWRSKDGGKNWDALQDNIIGLPGPRYVSHIEASHHDAKRVFVVMDGHRSNDDRTHIFVSEDMGDTWKSLANGIENEPAHVLVEDPQNEGLLFVGTEFGCYASLNHGKAWFDLGTDFPTVAVRDLDIQNRDSDLIAGTHGRGIWIIDIEPLRQLTAKVTAKDAFLCQPEATILWKMRSKVLLGHREWRAPNPRVGVPIYLWLKEAPEKKPRVTIHDITGKQIAVVSGKAKAGLQVLHWSATGSSGQEGRGRRSRGRQVSEGSYSARYVFGEETLVQAIVLKADPAASISPVATEPKSRN